MYYKGLFFIYKGSVFFDCPHYRTSFEIESLFPNIPLEETISICVDELFENKTSKVNNLTKYYKWKDGVAMRSSLVPTLANVFLSCFEVQRMSDCPIDYKPISYRRYVDDTFLLFSSELHEIKFLNYMN